MLIRLELPPIRRYSLSFRGSKNVEGFQKAEDWAWFSKSGPGIEICGVFGAGFKGAPYEMPEGVPQKPYTPLLPVHIPINNILVGN